MDKCAVDGKEARRRLGELRISTRPFFWPLHEPVVLIQMACLAGEQQPVAERLAGRGLYVASGLALTGEPIYEVAEGAKKVMKRQGLK